VATVVTVMDREGWDQRTDNIVVADPDRRELVWVPRDLWVESLRDRVNGAFCSGGHEKLIGALGELGLAVEHSLCVSRTAVERALSGVSVAVPVKERLDYWYPLSPTEEIEAGRKQVTFEPPQEQLSGERIHQWLGARFAVDRASSDLERIERQQAFVFALLEDGFDWEQLVADSELVSTSSADAFTELAAVAADWKARTLGPVAPETIDEMMVLVLRKPAPPRRWLRLLRRG
jgi:anionic cell wall polymer biosynthesis LytR-Cps2A-Psr (LCP) family protein